MGIKTSAFTISLLLFFAVSSFQACAYDAKVFDVRTYGAKADGKTDISRALLSAWRAACGAAGSSKRVLIPMGIYALGRLDIFGPCTGSMLLQVDGILRAPIDPNELGGDVWVSFNSITSFTVSGRGTFDGQGQFTWKRYNCMAGTNCKVLPTSIRFNFITNGIVQRITSLNSKNFHVNVLGCKNFTFQNFRISAPATSVNTDGIHIGRSTGIKILDTKIATGDDCISIGDNNQQITITGVTCGPGHGISVGSLGKYPNEGPVSGVFVSKCNLTNTDNGARIKTWPALYGGSASDLHFEDINMINVANPILIDQNYCPWNRCNKGPSKVKISNVSFKNIRGTSKTPVAVQLSCSPGNPCEDVKLSDINIKYTGSGGLAKSVCNNVKPVISGIHLPGC